MNAINKIENYFACCVFILLVTLPFSDLLIREIIKPLITTFTKIPASQTLVSHLTLLIGFSGAIIASREDKLLSLSNNSLFDEKLKGYIVHGSRWLSIFITLMLMVGGIDLVLVELSFEHPAYVAPNLPRWLFQTAIPLGFFIITLHLLSKMKKNIFSIESLVFLLIPVGFLFFHDFFRENSLIVYMAVALFIIAILNGAPIFIILSGFAILFFWYDYVPISAVIAESYRIVVSPHLATIPLFTLAGYFLAESKASDRLINVFKVSFGWLPGGTPVIVLLICGFFTALTGGSGVTILALGGLLFPMLSKDGYNKNFSLGLITASGSIGLLFPPSLPLILYGVTAGISIKSIFLAGIMPGLFLIIILSIWSYFSGKELNQSSKPHSVTNLGIISTLLFFISFFLPFYNLGSNGFTLWYILTEVPNNDLIGIFVLFVGGIMLLANVDMNIIKTATIIGVCFPLYRFYKIVSVGDIGNSILQPSFGIGGYLILIGAGIQLYACFSSANESNDNENFPDDFAKKILKTSWETKWELFIPIIILFGIFGGHAKLVETAAFIVVYVFIIETFVYKDLKLSDAPKIIVSCATLVGGVLIIIGSAMGLTSYLVDAQIPMAILSFMKEIIHSKYVFLILLNIFLLIIGCLMDIFSAIIIVVPLIAPLGVHYGVDPIHLAIIFIANLELGYLTPPVGMNLFLSAYRFEEKMPVIYKSTLPYFIVLLIAVIVITYFPAMTLWLV